MALDLNDPEVKAAVQEMIDAATKPLVDKRDQLLAENKKLKKNSEITPEAHQEALDRVEELEGKLTEVTKANKAALTEVEKYKGLYEGESAYTAKSLVESNLRKELQDAGVTDTDFLDTLMAKFIPSSKVETEGDARVVKVGDKALKDAIAEWKATPAAAKFIAAPSNSGGGALGGKGGGAARKFNEMTGQELKDLRASNPAEYDRLHKEFNDSRG
jgi:hypothetical protein